MLGAVILLSIISAIVLPKRPLTTTPTAPSNLATDATLSATVSALPTTPKSEADYQREAVQKHPDLGVAGSRFNAGFLALHADYRKTQPEFFRDPTWPIRLADQVASAQNLRSTSSPPGRAIPKRFTAESFLGLTENQVIARMGQPIDIVEKKVVDAQVRTLFYDKTPGAETMFVIPQFSGKVTLGTYRGTFFTLPDKH